LWIGGREYFPAVVGDEENRTTLRTADLLASQSRSQIALGAALRALEGKSKFRGGGESQRYGPGFDGPAGEILCNADIFV